MKTCDQFDREAIINYLNEMQNSRCFDIWHIIYLRNRLGLWWLKAHKRSLELADGIAWADMSKDYRQELLCRCVEALGLDRSMLDGYEYKPRKELPPPKEP